VSDGPDADRLGRRLRDGLTHPDAARGPSAGLRQAVVTGVRRRRARRHQVAAAGAAAVVVLAGVGAAVGLRSTRSTPSPTHALLRPDLPRPTGSPSPPPAVAQRPSTAPESRAPGAVPSTTQPSAASGSSAAPGSAPLGTPPPVTPCAMTVRVGAGPADCAPARGVPLVVKVGQQIRVDVAPGPGSACAQRAVPAAARPSRAQPVLRQVSGGADPSTGGVTAQFVAVHPGRAVITSEPTTTAGCHRVPGVTAARVTVRVTP